MGSKSPKHTNIDYSTWIGKRVWKKSRKPWT